MKLEIPFSTRFYPLILSGQKTQTARSRKYGKIGDHFVVSRMKAEITGLEKVRLQRIMDEQYRVEGFNSSEEFKRFWMTIHYKWQPEKEFWVHHFEVVE